MAARLEAIGRRVADIVRISRRSDRKPEPESEYIPLSVEERHQLQEECKEVLKKEDFGNNDFEVFRMIMIDLLGKESDPEESASLRDREAELNIEFGDYSISMSGDPVATDDSHVFKAYQYISYRPRQMKLDSFGNKLSDFKPILGTVDLVPISSSITFFSYFKERSESVFPKGTHPIEIEEEVSDKDVQAFCRRVYQVYVNNKETAVSSLQQ